MKKGKPFLNMDERNKQVAYRVMAIMYLLTILALQGIVIYRQFVMGQSIRDFEDIAVVMTVNSLFLVSALLYFGAIPVQKLKIKSVLTAYLAIVILGAIFIYLKYNVVQSPGLSWEELLHKLLIISAVSGIIVLFFVAFLLLGQKRMRKELDE
jgi:hypothetical protein